MDDHRGLADHLVGNLHGDRRLAVARAFVHRVVQTYWRESRPRGSREPRVCGLDFANLANGAVGTADGVAKAMARRPLDRAAFEISSLYTAMLPADMRSRMGAYFTPPPLVERLLDQVTRAGFDWREHRALDPACGGGAFLAPLAARMISTLKEDGMAPKAILQSVTSRIAGIELDPFSAWMSQSFLELVMADVVDACQGEVPTLIITQDALDMPDRWANAGFNLVVGNPPYGKVTLSPAQRVRYAASLFGHANLYGLFVHLAIRLVCPGGIISYVTPTSFLGGQYFTRLRRLLREQAPPIAMDFVADRAGVFSDVLQETMLAVFKHQPSKRTEASIGYLLPIGIEGSCRVVSVGRVELGDGDPSAPWILPRAPDQVAVLKLRPKLSHSLRCYGYTVSTGPLVWNRHRRQLAKEDGKDRLPLVWAESISDAGFVFSAKRKNHAPWFQLHDDQEHLVQKHPAILVQRTTAKEQERRIIAAVLPKSYIRHHGGVVIENHLNVIKPNSDEVGIEMETLAAYLNSAVADRLFRCINGSVAVSAYELEALPLPNPKVMSKLSALVARGSSRAEIDAFFSRTYGLTNE